MSKRVATANADGIARPALDIFGNPYAVAHTLQGIGGGHYVVIPPGTKAEVAAAKIAEIKAELEKSKPVAVKAKAPVKRKVKDAD